MKSKVVLIFLIFVLLAGCLSPENANEVSENSKLGGTRSNSLTIKTIDGSKLSFSDLSGNKIVLSFIATWCYSCLQEAINLREAVEEIGSPINVILIGVDGSESNSQLMKFIDEVGLPNWKVARGSPELLESFNVRALDTTIIFDEEGKVIYRDDGEITSKETFLSVLG